MATPTRRLSPILIAWVLSAWASSASAQVGSPTSYASLGTLNPAAGTYSLDTTTQTLTIGTTVYRGVIQAQPNGPNVIVFAFSNIALGDGVTINAVGSLPFALLSQTNVAIGGTATINLSAVTDFQASPYPTSTPGAGGGLGAFNRTPGATGQGPGGGADPANINSQGGGGGGGFGGNGGSGAQYASASNQAGGAGGAAYQPANGLAATLVGGSGGGGGGGGGIGGTARNGGAGGGGGLIGAAGSITVADTSRILANGGGGTFSPLLGSGGGGSGGGIVLNAQEVELAAGATVAANGGQGGTGSLSIGGGGGGGGGGRIVIRQDTFNVGSLAGSLSVAGGTSRGGETALQGATGGTGTVDILAGTSVVGGGQSLVVANGRVGNATLTSGNFEVQAGGRLTLANSAQTVGAFAGGGNATLTNSSLTVGVGNVSSTFAGNLTSDSSLTKVGAGTFALTGTNRLGGALAVNAGTLNVAGGGSAVAGAVVNSGTIGVGSGSTVASDSFTNNAGGRVTLAGSLATLAGGTFTNAAGATLGGNGTVAASLANAGTLRVGASDDLALTGATNTNTGTIALQGGTLEVARALANNAGGTITGRGTLYTNQVGASGVGLANLGAMNFSGGTTDIYGLAQNGVGGSIISAGGGVLTFHDGLNFLAGSTIRTEAGSRTVVFGPTLLKGSFTGAGAVELGGTINIDPELISFGGDLTLTSNTILNLAIEGSGRGTGYDSLAVAGLATLAGQLRFLVGNGFVPTVGQQFLAVSYGSRSGVFGSINAFGLTPDQFLVADYRADGLYLTVASNAVPEPTSLALLGLGVAGMITVARRR